MERKTKGIRRAKRTNHREKRREIKKRWNEEGVFERKVEEEVR